MSPAVSRSVAAPAAPPPIPFIDLQAQRRRIAGEVERAIARVLAHGQFIMGPEIAELEHRLAAYCGVKHAVTCGSGTDALMLLLMANGCGPGDAVFCPSFTFAASAEVVALVGATPVFVDVGRDDFNMAPASLEAAIAGIAGSGLTPRGVMPVDLFGQPARYPEIEAIARRHGLWVLADAAQSFGARLDNRRVGALGDFAATSFFPAKPLGCYGDGGAIFLNDDGLLEVLRSLRVHGQGRDKYENVRIGINGRMDTIQAAVLLEKLRIYDDELIARERVAARYAAALDGLVAVPRLRAGATSIWACYTIEVDDRDAVVERLKARGVPSMIYYPRPLHRQEPYARYPVVPGGLPVTEAVAARVMSLPMHAYLDETTQDRIIEGLRASLP
ncbi:MAG TPA: DegT/DnrJ/EryC1/StrS family aminotransferase [Candidatus Sulfotelmatobacter sp.]|nr:DegT/DnrJ/EryC1/StrS family aminotransferase [Candidatus Sulfotelmatobacter sp.]